MSLGRVAVQKLGYYFWLPARADDEQGKVFEAATAFS